MVVPFEYYIVSLLNSFSFWHYFGIPGEHSFDVVFRNTAKAAHVPEVKKEKQVSLTRDRDQPDDIVINLSAGRGEILRDNFETKSYQQIFFTRDVLKMW